MTFTAQSQFLPQLVRAPPWPGHQHRLLRRRRRRHRAAALAAVDHRPGRLARLVLGHGPARASRARSAELLRAAQAAGYRPAAGRRIDTRAADRQAAQCARPSSMPPGRRSDWTLARAIRTGALLVARARLLPARSFAWYAVQVHQTKYLIDVGFTPLVAGLGARDRQRRGHSRADRLGALSDRIGREWVWTAGCVGFAICYAALIALERRPVDPSCST